MTAEAFSRFPAATLVLEYLDKRIDGELSVPGRPAARIVVDGKRGRLGMRVPADGPPPTLPPLENISFTDLLEDGQVWFELSVSAAANPTDVYAVLCGVLDRIQLEHQQFAQAVTGVLASLRHMLVMGERLTREQQVGLLGELLTLVSAVAWVGEKAAASAWRGQAREEHDFGFAHIDVEVKTTTSERRRHLISGASQLMPTGGRPLYLLSIQLTAAGAQSGLTLPWLVERARQATASDPDIISRSLHAAGYRDEDAPSYLASWVLRTAPRFFAVDDAFPAITPYRLAQSVPRVELIEEIHYRVNLEGLTAAADPFPVVGR